MSIQLLFIYLFFWKQTVRLLLSVHAKKCIPISWKSYDFFKLTIFSFFSFFIDIHLKKRCVSLNEVSKKCYERRQGCPTSLHHYITQQDSEEENVSDENVAFVCSEIVTR